MPKKSKKKKLRPLKTKTIKQIPTLSLCMIAKDEEYYLPRLLDSVKDLIDEIILVDTGSTDKTKSIALEYGAKVFDFPWTGNFSEARNVSLENATCEWILIMDPDEKLAQRDIQSFKNLIQDNPKKVYYFNTRNYISDPYLSDWIPCKGEYPLEEEDFSGYIFSPKIRLLPNNKQLRFQYRVHEMITLSDSLKCGYKPEFSIIPIHHYGASKNNIKLPQKKEMYLELGIQKITEEPNDSHAHYELAHQYDILGDIENAIKYYQKCVELNPTHKKGLLRLGMMYRCQQKYPEAREALQKALHVTENKYEVYIQIGIVFLLEKRYKESLPPFEKALSLNPDVPKSYQYYAQSLYNLGQIDKAYELLKKSLELDPTYTRTLLLAGTIEFRKQNWREAETFLNKAVENDSFCVLGYSLLGATLMAQNRFDEAIFHLEKVLEFFPEDIDTLGNLGVIYAKKKEFDKGYKLLERAHELQPANEAITKNFEQIKIDMKNI